MRARLILAALAAGLFGCATTCPEVRPDEPTDPTVGYVDMQRLIAETSQGRSARQRLQELFRSRQQDLDQRSHELQAAREELDQLEGEEREAREQELQRQLTQLQSDYAGYQRELSQRESQLLQELVENVRSVARELSVRRGILVVLDRAAVASDEVRFQDLTDAVLSRYEERFGSSDDTVNDDDSGHDRDDDGDDDDHDGDDDDDHDDDDGPDQD